MLKKHIDLMVKINSYTNNVDVSARSTLDSEATVNTKDRNRRFLYIRSNLQFHLQKFRSVL